MNMKDEEEEYLTCRWCGEQKEDVQYRVDPYSSEICGDNSLYPLCDDCTYERAMDV